MTTSIEELRTLQTKAKEVRERRSREIPARDVEMIRLRFVEGLTLQAIGTRYGLTRQRVNQIVTRPL